MFESIAFLSFAFAGLIAIGGVGYYLDNWLDQDETTERATTARHRAESPVGVRP